MKRIISVFILIVSLLSLSACKFSGLIGNNLNGVVFGEKYIAADRVGGEQVEEYFIVEKDCVIYRYKTPSVSDYTITYKYTVTGAGMISVFYDSIEINDNNNKENDFVNKDFLLIVSKNVISTMSGDQFVRESYLNDELKNFGKKVE